jgi:hypothetical protein
MNAHGELSGGFVLLGLRLGVRPTHGIPPGER